MDKTSEVEGEVTFGELEFTNLIKVLIRGYRFHNHNNNPQVIIIPAIMEVDGIEIRYEGGAKPIRAGKKQGVNK